MKRIAVATIAMGLLVGCTPDEEKVRKVVDQALQECKEAEGEFAEVRVVEGTDEVLRETCEMEITGVELKDEFHASANVGPYTYLVGVDTETGVWMLTQVDWETIEDARRAVAGEDPPLDSRRRAEEAFAKAQEEMPTSAWIRIERIDNLLQMRKAQRSKEGEDAVSLGAAGPVLEETITWAKENNRPELAAQLQLKVVNYYKDFANKLEMAFGNLGSSDEHLEATIRQAEKDGDRETAKDYRETLEKARAERPKIIEMMQERIVGSRKAACDRLAKLDPNSLKGAIREQVVAVKDGTNCSPEAFEAPDPNALDEEVGDE